MFDVYKKEIEFAGKTLILETGKMARQADGSVLATVGGTTVLCTVVGSKTMREGQDFSRYPYTIKKKPMPPVKYQAVFSNAKAVLRKRKH